LSLSEKGLKRRRVAIARLIMARALCAALLTFCSTGLIGQSPDTGPGSGENEDLVSNIPDEVPVPALQSRVNDFTGTLAAHEIAQLESELAAYEAERGSQLVVLIVPTTGLETIEQYSIRVVDAWRLGRADVDDGILLLVAKNDRRVRIEVGYGLEGALPDATAKRIISDYIVPEFRDGNFAGGIGAGLSGIQAAIRDEPLPEPPRQLQATRDAGRSGGGSFQLLVFFGAFLLGAILRAVQFVTRLVLAGGLGVLVFGLALFFSLTIGSALFYAGAAFLISVLGIVPGRRGGIGMVGGGGFSRGGGFGGGFGGGGFGGGGGGFGGGGASGSW
jgi:uncharacterized protein